MIGKAACKARREGTPAPEFVFFLAPSLRIAEPILACYPLGFSARAQHALFNFIAAGAVAITDFGAADVSRAAALMQRFANLPMDFADATLVVLAERLHATTVFTLDRRDFTVYRVGRRTLRLLPKG